jgi:5-formyltetrahydrofolate cyclo-ligase
MNKEELRLIYKQKRAEIPREKRFEFDTSILAQILELIKGHKNIGVFLPIAKFNEINLTTLLKHSDYNWFAPKSNFTDRTMSFVQIDKNTHITENEFGIPEPISMQIIDPRLLDVIIIPMLVSDKKGYRVGYGKGFYDAFLPKCQPNCLRIGVSYFEPIDRIADVEIHDEPIHVSLYPKLDSF